MQHPHRVRDEREEVRYRSKISAGAAKRGRGPALELFNKLPKVAGVVKDVTAGTGIAFAPAEIRVFGRIFILCKTTEKKFSVQDIEGCGSGVRKLWG